jgi:hypothetical protein
VRRLVPVALWVTMAAFPDSGAVAECLPSEEPMSILLSQLPGPAVSPSPPAPATSPVLPVEPPINPAPAKPNPPEPPRNTCPSTTYVNCMPPVPAQSRTMCGPEYLQWMKEHCPGVEVVY